jgi:intracellular sulfur oxidation DsrE/DsrF family protein
MKRLMISALIGTALSFTAGAQSVESEFLTGPVIESFGPSAPVEFDQPLPEGTEFKVVFDIAQASEDDVLNKRFESVARFVNMHARAGVPLEDIQPAIVVHGGAAAHLKKPADGAVESKTTKLVEALIANDVTIYLCGQTAAARGIQKADLLPGVQMSLSAMTAHALLARDGYTLNPF